MRKIILASGSPRRKEIFSKLGISFVIEESGYIEDMTLDMKPTKLTQFLAEGKAREVAKRNDGAIVISCDTIVAFKDKVLGKPKDTDDAKKMLLDLNGGVASVVTGFAVLDTFSGALVTGATTSKIDFKIYDEAQIDQYIATGEPMDKAGAFAVQGHGASLIEKIEGDFDSIVGLPLQDIKIELEKLGVKCES